MIKELDCEVLVVGAGPAGSSAACKTAGAGLKTIFIDKREEVGYPVRCAEGVGNYLFPFLPFKIPKEELVWTTEGIEFWAEDITIRRTGVQWAGYTLNRRAFDKYLSRRALHAGAKLMLNTELIDFEFKDNHVVKTAVVKNKEGKFWINPKVVIGADGSDSTTLKLLGEYHPKKGAVAEIHAWEMHNLNLTSPKFEQVYVGDFTETGYAYVFPISKTKANIGIGCAFPKKPMEEYFNEFLEIPEMRRQTKNAYKVEDKGGKANALPLCDRWQYGNVILAGDSADQNIKPFVEGILPAVICGEIAGKTVAKYLQGKEPLERYTHEVQRILGPILKQSDETGNLVYELFHMKQPKEYLLLLNLLADLNSPEKIEKMKKLSYEELKNQTLEWQKPSKQMPTQLKEYLGYQYIKLENLIHKTI